MFGGAISVVLISRHARFRKGDHFCGEVLARYLVDALVGIRSHVDPGRRADGIERCIDLRLPSGPNALHVGRMVKWLYLRGESLRPD